MQSSLPSLSLHLSPSQLSQIDMIKNPIDSNSDARNSVTNTTSSSTTSNTTSNTPLKLMAINGKRQRILLCAPSNAAVDELLLRLLKGVWNKHGVLSVVKVNYFITIIFLKNIFHFDSINFLPPFLPTFYLSSSISFLLIYLLTYLF